MDLMEVKSSLGKYTLILKEISISGKGYAVFSEIVDDLAAKEAINVLLAHGAKNIFLGMPTNYNFSLTQLVYTTDCYELEKKVFKADKKVKLRPLNLENRETFKDISNQALKSVSGTYFNNHDVLTFIKEKKNYGIFEVDRELVGTYMVTNQEIENICITTECLHQGFGKRCLIKLINKIEDKVKIFVSSNNNKAIKLFENVGFRKIETVLKWYQYKE